MRPKLDRVALPARDRARRPDRGMADEWLVVLGLEVPCAARLGLGADDFLLDLRLGDVGLHPAVDVFRHRRPVAPYRLGTELPRPLDRVFFTLGDDGRKVTVAHEAGM